MKISKRKKVENSSQVALKCGRTCSPVAEADNEVRLCFQARDCPLHETLRVKTVRTRTFPVAETDGEVGLHFQARACLQDRKGLVDERGRRDTSAVQKRGGE